MKREYELISDSFNITCAKCGSSNIKRLIDSFCTGEEEDWECLDCGNKERMFEFYE